jgi:hypothetical protein
VFYFAVNNIDEGRAAPAELTGGGLARHHCLMPHKSLKNRTKNPHRGIAMHRMDAQMPIPPTLELLPDSVAPILRRKSTSRVSC